MDACATVAHMQPGHGISYKTACFPSEDSDQPTHVHSLCTQVCRGPCG